MATWSVSDTLLSSIFTGTFVIRGQRFCVEYCFFSLWWVSQKKFNYASEYVVHMRLAERDVLRDYKFIFMFVSNLFVYKCALEKETFFSCWGDKNCVKIAFQRYNDSNYFFFCPRHLHHDWCPINNNILHAKNAIHHEGSSAKHLDRVRDWECGNDSSGFPSRRKMAFIFVVFIE